METHDFQQGFFVTHLADIASSAAEMPTNSGRSPRSTRLAGLGANILLVLSFTVTACGSAADDTVIPPTTGGHAASGGSGGGAGGADAGGGTSGAGGGAAGGGAAGGGGTSGAGGMTPSDAAAGTSQDIDARHDDAAGSVVGDAGGLAVDGGGDRASPGEASASDGSVPGSDAGDGGARFVNFVTRQGVQFREGGQRHVFVGANFYQAMNLAAEAAGGDAARLRRELDRLKALGVTNVRVLAASEGPDSAPYRATPALMTSPDVYNELVFKGLDLLLDELSRRGIRAVMVLNNYWEWSGGMAQYVSWSDNSAIPYLTPSGGGDYNKFVAYVDRFYACTACQTAYRNNIRAIVGRVNTINSRKYRDDPVVFSWQLANEPRDYSANWIDDTAKFIKSLDPNHMVSVGSEGTWGGNFNATHQSAAIDYTTCHIWVEPWGKYDASNASAAALQTATDFATGYLRDHDSAAKQLGKPLVLEEFGLARDGWTAGGKYDPAATTTNRDKYYRSLYAIVEASLASGGALAGDNFWAWGGEARPPSKWVGDPPHETPGWFSVYDADSSTTAIIAGHAATVNATR